MSSHRLVRIGTVVLLCFGLSLSAAQARQIQLCGFSTLFADFLVIDATLPDEDVPRLILTGSWTQFVPHSYLLMGMSPLIREPVLVDPNLFIGKFMIANTSASFLGNPACTVDARILDTTTNPAVPTFTGTGAFLCFGGTSGTFQATLSFTLTTCAEPGFPGGGSVSAQDSIASASSALTPSTLERIMTRAEDEGLKPFGEAMNE